MVNEDGNRKGRRRREGPSAIAPRASGAVGDAGRNADSSRKRRSLGTGGRVGRLAGALEGRRRSTTARQSDGEPRPISRDIVFGIYSPADLSWTSSFANLRPREPRVQIDSPNSTGSSRPWFPTRAPGTQELRPHPNDPPLTHRSTNGTQNTNG